MSKVRIITDSNAYLSPALVEQLGITVVPHRIKVGGAFFEEDADFTADDFFGKLADAQRAGSTRLPEVQAPNINAFLDAFQDNSEGEQIVCIHMSSELSPMWATARKAAEMLRGRYSIRVIDSQSTSFGLGLLVEMAARTAAAGATLNEVARVVNGAIPHLYFTAFSESLSYLERSAALGPSQSLLGTMLGIKAMLMMEDGHLVTQEKVQTREEVVDKLAEFVTEFAAVQELGIFQQNYEGPCAELINRLRETLPKVKIQKISYPPSLAVYLGPGVVGVLVHEGMY